MYDFPTVNIRSGALEISAGDEGLVCIVPLLELELNILVGAMLERQTEIKAQLIINNIFDSWVIQGFVYEFNGVLRVDIVKLVANKLGYDIIRFKPIYNSSFSFSMVCKQTLARCLTDLYGDLNHQLKIMPAELIEWFGESIDEEILDNAIEKYKNEMILDVAGINKKGKLNVNSRTEI